MALELAEGNQTLSASLPRLLFPHKRKEAVLSTDEVAIINSSREEGVIFHKLPVSGLHLSVE